MPDSANSKSPREFFNQMMRVAGGLGCQFQPNPDNPNLLRGLCPFHEGYSLQNLKTLTVNIRTKKFWCTHCETGGNPLVFIAMTWSVSVRDARQLAEIKGDEIGADRPPYPQAFFRNEERNYLVPQNTAVLTIAMRFYTEQLKKNYEPMYLLARLGVTPEKAQRAGVGYCTGYGLREYLLEKGIRESEIEQSPIFQRETGFETLSGRIVLADMDYSGATTWITSTRAEDPMETYGWRSGRPKTFGLPGYRSYLFNSRDITSENPQILLTDDIRLYILASANRIPSTLMTRRRREGESTTELASRMTETLSERGVTRLVVAIHDRQRNNYIQDMFTKKKQGNQARSLYRKDIIDTLNLNTRDLALLNSMEEEAPEPEWGIDIMETPEALDVTALSNPLPEDHGIPEA